MAVMAIGSVHDDLVSVTVRLTEEFSEIPAGSVMRCVSRVLWRARRDGVPASDLTDEVVRVSRLLLQRRHAGRLAAGPALEGIGWGSATYRRAG